MSQSFDKPPRAVLFAIAVLSGDSYRDVDGTELIAYLERKGVSFEGAGLHNLMQRLMVSAVTSRGLAAVGCASRDGTYSG